MRLPIWMQYMSQPNECIMLLAAVMCWVMFVYPSLISWGWDGQDELSRLFAFLFRGEGRIV